YLYYTGSTSGSQKVVRMNLSTGQNQTIDFGVSINPVLVPVPGGPMLVASYRFGQNKGIWSIDTGTGAAHLLDASVSLYGYAGGATLGADFYFAASNANGTGIARLNQDGTLSLFIVPGTGPSGDEPHNLTALGNRLVFSATGDHGTELYALE